MCNHKKRFISLAVLLASSPLYALSLSEVEQNQPITSSQYIRDTAQAMEIGAAIGDLSAPSTTTTTTTTFTDPFGSFSSGTALPVAADEPDLDYYSFYANAGDVITFDIDNGDGDASPVDTVIGVYDADRALLRMNDDADSIDSGSLSTHDSRIENFRAPANGIYYVGVSAYPRFFMDGGDVDSSSSGAGDYKLVISGVTRQAVVARVQQINIDIKPGSSGNAPINPKSKGKIPVALLSDRNFNATAVDLSSVTFGKTGGERSLSKCNSAGVDVNGDGKLDLVCHFENQATRFDYDSLEGVLRGKTHSGVAFEGRGLLKVVPTLTK